MGMRRRRIARKAILMIKKIRGVTDTTADTAKPVRENDTIERER
jgi:hypothetical protein